MAKNPSSIRYYAQELLHLTANEFNQFREGKLDISDILIERLHQSTGFSKLYFAYF
jgi:hypothetical protein